MKNFFLKPVINHNIKENQSSIASLVNSSDSSSKQTGANIIVNAFIEEDVDVIFGYPGGAILPFYDALFMQNKINKKLINYLKKINF